MAWSWKPSVAATRLPACTTTPQWLRPWHPSSQRRAKTSSSWRIRTAASWRAKPPKGLPRPCEKKGKKEGGIVRIVFVAAVVPAEGQPVMALFRDIEMDLHGVELKNEYLEISADYARSNYSDMPPEDASVWASKMREHVAASFCQKLTYAAYKDIPVSYLLCEEDKAVIPEMQNQIIADMESVMGGTSVDRHPVKAGHHINASQPKTMAALIRRALG
ncbi:Alpha/beta-hydrolase [Mycena sanguinolenta]|uniref:Alpha/beta-hydrolase n=1 Tax=Mycena sanguinolenta TaxID=230812 RepID=A0A8H6XPR7_9AGAR|nr:Alpha/beta-hydrolase [Mycena sanguinolenta]